MTVLWFYILAIFVLSFGGVVFFGAPYLPTLDNQQKAAFNLLKLKKGQTMLELGVGDGKVAVYAAKQGIKVIGYELNPLLYLLSKIRTLRYGKQVHIIWGNFWSAKWPEADAAYTFLLPKYMPKLHAKCLKYSCKPLRLVSVAFEIEGLTAIKSQKSVFLYEYK